MYITAPYSYSAYFNTQFRNCLNIVTHCVKASRLVYSVPTQLCVSLSLTEATVSSSPSCLQKVITQLLSVIRLADETLLPALQRQTGKASTTSWSDLSRTIWIIANICLVWDKYFLFCCSQQVKALRVVMELWFLHVYYLCIHKSGSSSTEAVQSIFKTETLASVWWECLYSYMYGASVFSARCYQLLLILCLLLLRP